MELKMMFKAAEVEIYGVSHEYRDIFEASKEN